MGNLLDNYSALRRHYQFTNWWIEILPCGEVSPSGFPPCILQEVRDGKVVRRSEKMSFRECEKLLQARAHKMSLEAGAESAPPEALNIRWDDK